MEDSPPDVNSQPQEAQEAQEEQEVQAIEETSEETQIVPLSDGVFVLCYHAFTDNPHDITFPINVLNRHMETLKNAGFNFITTEDFIAQRYRGLNNVLITSDDGNRSVYRAYHEVFKKYGIKPLIAIYPSIISIDPFALTWEQVAELHEEGAFIASHGYEHLYLHSAAYRRAPNASRKEVVESKIILESKLGFDIDIFVYPYGSRGSEIVKLVEETGYKFAFTIDQGIIYREDQNKNRFELPRYMVTNSNVRHIFALMFRTIKENN